jgi:hypothetical protein
VWNRFRPAGPPGAAGTPGAAGVPADRREAVAAELAPVFTALEAVIAECAELRRTGRAGSERIAAAAAEEARVVLARARADAPAQREAEAARLTAAGRMEAERIESAATEQADRIRRQGDRDRPDQLARIMARVRADLAGGGRA